MVTEVNMGSKNWGTEEKSGSKKVSRKEKGSPKRGHGREKGVQNMETIFEIYFSFHQMFCSDEKVPNFSIATD